MKPKSSLRSFLALAGSTLLGVSSVNATQFWDGTGLDANWNTPENWGGDTLPDFGITINFGSLSSAAGIAFGNVVVPSQTTANNNLTAGTTIKNITFGNNGQANRTGAYTLQGNSIVLGIGTNDTIGTTALHAAAIVSSIEDVITLNIDLGSPGAAQNRQFLLGANHNLKIDGVISGGANAILLARSANNSKLTLTNANNSYLGVTNIGGTNTGINLLEITSIANGGLNSSIGASSSAATNLRFGALNQLGTDTLRYIGATNASTDRLFQLTGNAVISSAIESSGAGTLSFTNTGAIASSHQKARNFYLGGTNTGDNTFAPTLSNFTEVSTFTKQGAGKWILTGNHTYTGATTVSEGTLIINGSTSTSSLVTVGVNGTLGGTGTVGGNTTISGTHSPGNSPGIQTFTGNLSYVDGGTPDPTVNWELNGNTVTNVANPNAVFDQIIVGGNLDFTDITAINLSFNGGGSSVLWTDTLWDSDQSWTLYDVTGTTSNFNKLNLNTTNWLDSGSNLFSTTGGSFSLGQSGQDVVLNYTVVPEPGAALIGSLGLLALLRRRRS